MTGDTLLRAMPDLVAMIRPDGQITERIGGHGMPFLAAAAHRPGASTASLQDLLDAEAAAMTLRLIRRVLADRRGAAAGIKSGGISYHVRAQPQGPHRALCVFAKMPENSPGVAANAASGNPPGGGFLPALHEAVTDARLRERSFALCLIHLDGVADIGHLIDHAIRQRVLEQLLARLRDQADSGDPVCAFAGILGETMLAVVLDGTGERGQIRRSVDAVIERLGGPVIVDGARFAVEAHVGAAVFGQDASTAPALLDHARAAMLEARRLPSGSVQFYSDTLRMLPVLRLDVERELRLAIEDDQIRLHYCIRHDLRTGQASGIQAQMRWQHPIRGEIAPGRFLKIAEATDLAPAVSRAALERLVRDLPTLRQRLGAHLPVSFGPLRQHITSGRLTDDCRQPSIAAALASGPLELRIGERTLNSLVEPQQQLDALIEQGAKWVVDEFGAGTSSLHLLAQLPLAGVQIDRALVVAAMHDPGALRSCRAILRLADGLDLPTIAPGIDEEAARHRLAQLGCGHGLGDLYPRMDVAMTAEPGAIPVEA